MHYPSPACLIAHPPDMQQKRAPDCTRDRQCRCCVSYCRGAGSVGVACPTAVVLVVPVLRVLLQWCIAAQGQLQLFKREVPGELQVPLKLGQQVLEGRPAHTQDTRKAASAGRRASNQHHSQSQPSHLNLDVKHWLSASATLTAQPLLCGLRTATSAVDCSGHAETTPPLGFEPVPVPWVLGQGSHQHLLQHWGQARGHGQLPWPAHSLQDRLVRHAGPCPAACTINTKDDRRRRQVLKQQPRHPAAPMGSAGLTNMLHQHMPHEAFANRAGLLQGSRCCVLLLVCCRSYNLCSMSVDRSSSSCMASLSHL